MRHPNLFKYSRTGKCFERKRTVLDSDVVLGYFQQRVMRLGGSGFSADIYFNSHNAGQLQDLAGDDRFSQEDIVWGYFNPNISKLNMPHGQVVKAQLAVNGRFYLGVVVESLEQENYAAHIITNDSDYVREHEKFKWDEFTLESVESQAGVAK